MTQRASAALVPASPKPARRSRSVVALVRACAWVCCAVVGLLAATVVWFVVMQPVQVLPRMQPLPAFSLQDQQNRWLADSELRGQVLVVSFGSRHCGAACAETTALMQTLHAQLQATQQPVLLLTIDLDAPGASEGMRHEYATRLGAVHEHWRVLRGEPSEIKALVGGGFGIYYEGGADASRPPVLHEQRVVLVDSHGVVRAAYQHAQLDAGRVLRDIVLVQREAASQGLARGLYNAAHLFVCYPD